ncbi:hypothetical protein AAL_02955 [Moelleriella libera RCEF 2490]|uniref:Trafficking protein particle complex subunit 13 N-terminal domain-containing protein n=1 Tax=Moelleriella libera RCEF 2490 TaxID=1081109 RepID=A0A168E5F9_9HYPO|nr:hypothetical protein AAL_02955 [Moelleriella libera RCEF 2490]
MSHQRYPSHDPLKEPHYVSVKVLRLSRPSLVPQYPHAASPLSLSSHSISAEQTPPPPSQPQSSPLSSAPASLAYTCPAVVTTPSSNPDPFLLSPLLNLPASFGAAYVGETFSCTLCVNNDSNDDYKKIRDVRLAAEMKTPGSSAAAAHKLSLKGSAATTTTSDELTSSSTSSGGGGGGEVATDLLARGDTVQRIVSFDLKEEGNHVLAVTVSYYEASETSGRTRTFRKLYQFICKPSLIVRTKVGPLPVPLGTYTEHRSGGNSRSRRKWVLEAQLENCGDDVMQLDKVVMEMEKGLVYQDCNWAAAAGGGGKGHNKKPVLHPGEVEQICFVVSARQPPHEQGPEGYDGDDNDGAGAGAGDENLPLSADGRIIFGVLGIGWHGEMGNRGFLSTGKLGVRVTA